MGDLTPCDCERLGLSDADKHQLEEKALLDMVKELDPPIASEIHSLWKEYDTQSSEEAKIVKDFDKLELLLQADDYEKTQGKELQEFFDRAHGKVCSQLQQCALSARYIL